MPRGRKVSPEQIIATLRQIEGQLAQGMSLALACQEAGLSEQGRDRRLARPLQSGSAALLLGLPASRARDPRLCQPPTHVTDHAVVSQNSVQNPGQVGVVSQVQQKSYGSPRRAGLAAAALEAGVDG